MATVYLSAPDDVDDMEWGMSPALHTIYTGISLRTTEHGQILMWENEAFDNGQARFCQNGEGMLIVFKGCPPVDCGVVELVAYRDK